MFREIKEFFLKDCAWGFFLLFAFSSMISTPLARVALVLSLVSLLATKKGRASFKLSLPAYGWLIYFGLAIIVSFIMTQTLTDELLEPARGFKKVNKLIWFIGIPLASSLVTTKERFYTALKVVLIGASLIAVHTIFYNILYAWLQVTYPRAKYVAQGRVEGIGLTLYNFAAALGLDDFVQKWLYSDYWPRGRPFAYHGKSAFSWALIHQGTMDDAQRIMTGFITAVSLFLSPVINGKWRKVLYFLMPVLFIGLLITCKRGPLLACMIVCGLIFITRIKWRKSLTLLVIFAATLFSIAPARQRIMDLPHEFNAERGGRMLMWTEIVPELHKEHPYGIGFRALTSRKMEAIDPRVEPNRTHVHSTPLQAFVDFGYAGLLAWGAWMALSFIAGLKLILKNKGNAAFIAPAGIFAGLFLFSIVEYNLADAGIVIIYSIAMGLSAAKMSEE